MEENRSFTIEHVMTSASDLERHRFIDTRLTEKEIIYRGVISEAEWNTIDETSKALGWRVTHIDGKVCHTCKRCGALIAHGEVCGKTCGDDEDGDRICKACLRKAWVVFQNR